MRLESLPSEFQLSVGGHIRPMRVLVASRDSRFLNLARFVLPRSGLLVEPTHRLSRVRELVERLSTHVLVLDATDSPAAAVQTAGALESARPQVAVVLVAEGGDRPHRGARSPCLNKWSIHSLADEIERAYERAQEGDEPSLGAARGEQPVRTL